jgi:hypothetical protein
MKRIDEVTVRAFLAEVGNRKVTPAQLYLIGGSGLLLLGSSRQTLDIDYVADERQTDQIDADAIEVAEKMGLVLEAVPIDQFVPVDPGADSRRIHLGRFGKLDAYLFDPYAIALSKLDRGIKTDIADIFFLLNNGFVQIEQLEQVVISALDQSREYDLDSSGIQARLAQIKGRL